MPRPNQPTTASYTASMTFYIEQTKTGNREFSATVTQSASSTSI